MEAKTDLSKLLSSEDLQRFNALGMWEADKIPHFTNIIRLIKAQAGWWSSLPPMRNGFTVFNLAKEIGFDNHILTKGPKHCPNAWKEKVEWCQHHFDSSIDIHITSDKGLIYGKFLYDDYPEFMTKWLRFRPRGLGIMPVNDNNKDFTHPQVIKWDGNNIDEVKSALLACYNRKVGCK